MARGSDIDIFGYVDYRRYLADYYREQKKRRPAFSYRFFSTRAGLNSTGLYKDVVDGRQSLGRSLIRRFSKAIGHTEREAAYFENLVFFCEATTVEERTEYYRRMLASCGPRTVRVEADRFEYYSQWYYSAIRALVSCGDFKGDYAGLARRLDPPVRAADARKAVQLLVRLGFVRKNAADAYEVSDQIVTTGRLGDSDPVRKLRIVKFQNEMMDLARQALERVPSQRMEMSTVTVSVSAQTANMIKDEVAALRRKVLKMAEEDQAPSRVYQLNHQFFPMSRIEDDDA